MGAIFVLSNDWKYFRNLWSVVPGGSQNAGSSKLVAKSNTGSRVCIFGPPCQEQAQRVQEPRKTSF